MAWLVDQVMPEFRELARAEIKAGDLLMSPTRSEHPRLARYAWSGLAGDSWSPSPFFLLRRSLESRRLAEQGAARREAMLRHEAELAQLYAGAVPFDARHLVVGQGLLPELWRNGVLGGRSFSVLMTRLPMAEIHRRLDAVLALHPERTLLGDFRAPAHLVSAEAEALAAAQEIITPHTEIAGLFGCRARLIPWSVASAKFRRGDRVLFPGPTAGRKGAFEVRAAAQALGVKLAVGGSMLEGDEFWQGMDVVRSETNPLDGCRLLVHPAIVEDQPRRILSALAAGMPVVATRACGVPEQPGLTLVEAGDAEALTEAMRRILDGASS